MSNTDIPKYTQPQSSLIRETATVMTDGDPKTAETVDVNFKSPAKQRELTFKEKLKRSFVKEDLKDLGEYLLFDIFIPGLQRNAWDLIVGTTSKALGIPVPSNMFSANRPFYTYSDGYSGRDSRNYTNYNQTQPRTQSRIQSSRINRPSPRRSIYQTNTITWDYEEDANTMMSRLINAAKSRPFISVHTFYNLAEVHDGNDYTNTAYGWPSTLILSEADVDNDGYGYYICLPSPQELPNNGRY